MLPRENPFRSAAVDKLPYIFLDQNLSILQSRLKENGGRGAIVGPCGSGKTTLLDLLDQELVANGLPVSRIKIEHGDNYQTLSEKLSPATLHERCCALVDGVETLSRAAQLYLMFRLRRTEIAVVTAHRPTIYPTLHLTRVTPTLLVDLASKLAVPLSLNDSIALLTRHRGNIRSTFRELYDRMGSVAPLASGLEGHISSAAGHF